MNKTNNINTLGGITIRQVKFMGNSLILEGKELNVGESFREFQ